MLRVSGRPVFFESEALQIGADLFMITFRVFPAEIGDHILITFRAGAETLWGQI
jgi:hypothetical protein